MKKGIIITGIILTFSADYGLKAQDINNNTTVIQDQPLQLYRDQEFSVDFFGGGTLDEHDVNHVNGSRIKEDGRLGLGGGGSFFIVRYLGIEGEVYTENPDKHFIDETSG